MGQLLSVNAAFHYLLKKRAAAMSAENWGINVLAFVVMMFLFFKTWFGFFRLVRYSL